MLVLVLVLGMGMMLMMMHHGALLRRVLKRRRKPRGGLGLRSWRVGLPRGGREWWRWLVEQRGSVGGEGAIRPCYCRCRRRCRVRRSRRPAARRRRVVATATAAPTVVVRVTAVVVVVIPPALRGLLCLSALLVALAE